MTLLELLATVHSVLSLLSCLGLRSGELQYRSENVAIVLVESGYGFPFLGAFPLSLTPDGELLDTRCRELKPADIKSLVTCRENGVACCRLMISVKDKKTTSLSTLIRALVQLADVASPDCPTTIYIGELPPTRAAVPDGGLHPR